MTFHFVDILNCERCGLDEKRIVADTRSRGPYMYYTETRADDGLDVDDG